MANPVLDRLYADRTSLLDQVDSVTSDALDGDRDLSSAELELISRCHSRIEAELDPQIETLETIERTRSAHLRASPPVASPPVPAAPAPAGPGDTIYRTFAEYARDVVIAKFDPIASLAGPGARAAALERIDRVMANTLSADIPGIIPPQHIAQIFDLITTARPIVQAVRNVNLTSGKLQYPDIAQRPSVGKQVTEKTEAPSQKLIINMVEVVADTFVGAGDLSWQAINWSTPNALQLWFDLAAEEYARQTEAAAGTVLTSLAAGAALDMTTLEAVLTAIMADAGAIYASTRRRADTIFADVTSGYRLAGLVSEKSPVFVTGGTFSISSGTGNLAGLRLVISPGIATNHLIVGDSTAMFAAETAGAPVELRAVEPVLGGMEVGVIGAFVAKIVDTGAFKHHPVTP